MAELALALLGQGADGRESSRIAGEARLCELEAHWVERRHRVVVIMVVVDAEEDSIAEPEEPTVDIDRVVVTVGARAVVGCPVEVREVDDGENLGGQEDR